MGGKIGVLVDVETDVVNDAVKEMAKNIAMQAAALKPLYTNRNEVSQEYICLLYTSRQRHRLLSASWRKFIPQPAVDQKKMRIIKMRLWRLH